MTDSAWKPVPHDVDCQSKYVASGFQEGPTLPCSCDGTRWHGYGERVGDLAGVYALCQWFGMMREPAPPSDDVRDLIQRVQYLVDNWPAELPDGGITFPDGKFWPTC